MANKRLLTFILIILALSLISILSPQLQTLTGHAIQDYYPKEQAILERVIDGDTIEAKVGEEVWKIRLLGINTPEKNMPFASSAKDFLKQYENKSIELLRDKDDTDLYKRKIRYLFYEDNLVGVEILKKGFANAYYTSGLIYEKELLEAEKQARNSAVGIWQASDDECAPCIKLDNLNALNESFKIKNLCDFKCDLDGWFVKDAGRNIFHLEPLAEQASQIYYSKKDIWNNNGDKFFMFDKEGYLVVYYEY